MKAYVFPLAFLSLYLFSCTSSPSDKDTTYITEYQYAVDLTSMQDDQLEVVLSLTGTLPEQYLFCLPKVIPGAYANLDFGQYVRNFRALDINGKPIGTKKIGENCWELQKASSLESIRYNISDTWERYTSEEHLPNSSVGSSFTKDTFVWNNAALFGYIKGQTKAPYQVQIKHPKNLQVESSAYQTILSPEMSQLEARDYADFIDSPVMVGALDSHRYTIGPTEIKVVCLAKNSPNLAKKLGTYIKPLLQAQKKYLNNNLQSDHYTFFQYYQWKASSSMPSYSDGMEHHSASLHLNVLQPNLKLLQHHLYEVANPAFFQTVLPKGLHPKVFLDFDYNQATYSKHQWLFEGTTEYFTLHSAVHQNLESLESFLLKIETKLKNSKQFDPSLSLVTLSANPIAHKKAYGNIKEKGALVSMCLDIELRKRSKGAFGLQDLVVAMLDKYNKETPLEEATFFQELAKASGQEAVVLAFITDYIEGTKELPVAKYLQEVGFVLDVGIIVADEQASQQQLSLRKSWLGQ